jgi:hypothetical protein
MKKVLGFHYDDMNGWQSRNRPTDRPVWVITDEGRCCISDNGVLVKWSLIGTQALCWHPKEVTEEDFMQYNPPPKPTNMKIVRED